MLGIFIFMGAIVYPTEGLKCITCTFSPGISGSKDGCNDINDMEKYLTDCENRTTSIKETEKVIQENGTQGTELAPVSDLIGKLYCYTFISQLNGKWLTERGCSSSKVPEDLSGTCENVTDKNSSTLALTSANICYCRDVDGCNKEITVRNISNLEIGAIQNSNLSILLNNSKSTDKNINPSKIVAAATRSTFNSLTSHSRIQIIPTDQNPFYALQRNNSTENSKGEMTAIQSPNISAPSNAASRNASTGIDVPVTTKLKATQINLTGTINSRSNNSISVQNGTIERKNSFIVLNNNATTEGSVHVNASKDLTTIPSTATHEDLKDIISLNDTNVSHTIKITINTDASKNGSEKTPAEKECKSPDNEKNNGKTIRPFFTCVSVLAFVSVIVVLSM